MMKTASTSLNHLNETEFTEVYTGFVFGYVLYHSTGTNRTLTFMMV